MALTQTEKASILANLSAVLATQEGIEKIATHVADGDIIVDELANTGSLTPDYRQKITDKVVALKADKTEDNLWQQAVAQNTIDAYQNYLTAYPAGKYTAQANTMIAGLQQQQRQSQKQQYLEVLRSDINAYNTTELKMYGITYDDIVGAGINLPNGIRGIWDDAGINLGSGKTPDSLQSGRTEIYFWGTPGSGKTCTLAALLSTANKNGFFMGSECAGYDYMAKLSNFFYKSVATLPAPTPVQVTQELSFDLLDDKAVHHPVTLVDISGEIFRCFYKKISYPDTPISPDLLSTYNTLCAFLKSGNPKYHFFVIDVHNKDVDADGLRQTDYLAAAAQYFDANNILNSSTAGISIIATKSDLLGATTAERQQNAKEFLNAEYKSFVNTIKSIAYKNKLINKSTDPIPLIPFTLGNVYLQNKCLFNQETSKDVIRFLQQNVAKTSVKRKFGWLNR